MMKMENTSSQMELWFESTYSTCYMLYVICDMLHVKTDIRCEEFMMLKNRCL